MKLDPVKTLLAAAVSLVLGFICEIIAPESDSRNWISLAVGFVSIFTLLLPAMGIRYKNVPRGASIKLFAWMTAAAVVIANIVFSCFTYRVDSYLAVILLMVVIGWGIIYGLYSAKTIQK